MSTQEGPTHIQYSENSTSLLLPLETPDHPSSLPCLCSCVTQQGVTLAGSGSLQGRGSPEASLWSAISPYLCLQMKGGLLVVLGSLKLGAKPRGLSLFPGPTSHPTVLGEGPTACSACRRYPSGPPSPARRTESPGLWDGARLTGLPALTSCVHLLGSR